MSKEPKECPICKESEWKSLDDHRSHRYWYNQNLRYKNPVGFKICNGCGFCTYDYVDDLAEVYDNARKVIGVNNIITCNRKGEYHKSFLNGVFDDVISEEMTINSNNIKEHDLKALDVGCAQGYLLNLYHEEYGFKKENLFGTEYADTARNYAKNVYGLDTAHDIPEGSKYDFISYYHVLEHIPSPDKELEKIKGHLNDDGLLYISVPVWFGTLEEASGPPCIDFENLFHVNHINTWSKQGFINLLNNAGLEVIKTTDRIYGCTVLCKKGEVKPIVKESAEEIERILLSQKTAIDLLNAKQYGEAYNTYPNYPDLYVFHSMSKDVLKDINKQMAILSKGLEETGDHLKIKEHMASILYQWDESGSGDPVYSNNIKRSEELLLEVLSEKITESALFTLGMINGKYKKDRKEAKKYLQMAIDINPSRFGEIQNFICNFDSLLVD